MALARGQAHPANALTFTALAGAGCMGGFQPGRVLPRARAWRAAMRNGPHEGYTKLKPGQKIRKTVETIKGRASTLVHANPLAITIHCGELCGEDLQVSPVND